MAYPPAITLRPCTLGGSTALESGTQLTLSAEITASRSLKWGATGWQFPSLKRTVTGTEGAELSFSLPVTDQDGWRLNDDSGSIIDVSTPGSYTHTYTIKLTTLSGVRPVGDRIIGPFVLPTEDLSPIDLDLILPAPTVAGGVVLVPDSLSARVDAIEAGGGGTGSGTGEDAAVAGFVEAPGSMVRDALRGSFAQRSYPPVSALSAAHPVTPQVTPTYDGSGQAVHPDVLVLDEPFGGYRYWMAMTPYPSSNEDYENPSILASHDGIAWVVPAGLTNPIDVNPPGFLADPCLALHDGVLYCVYDGTRVKSSTDGVVWSARSSITLGAYGGLGAKLSPTIEKSGGQFHYWCVDIGASPNGLYHATGATPTAYGDMTPCVLTGGPVGRDLWHISAREVPGGFVGAFTYCNLDTSGSGSALHLASSADGINWAVVPTPILAGESATPWASNMVYRGCLIPGTGVDGVWGRLWYSALSLTGEWRIGLATVTRLALSTDAGNTAVGLYAQRAPSGAGNTAIGARAQAALTTGVSNTAVGASAQAAITSGGSNAAVGQDSQRSLTDGGSNTAVGARAQRLLTTGSFNVAVGRDAQANLSTGTNNVSIGFSAALGATTGSDNLALGHKALYAPNANVAYATTTGARQVAIGTESGQASAAVSNNIVAIGYRARAAGHAATAIGSEAVASAGHAVALGLTAAASGLYSMALGSLTSASGAGAVAIGQDSAGAAAAATEANAFVLGTALHRYRMPGLPTANPGVGSGVLWNDAGTVKVA